MAWHSPEQKIALMFQASANHGLSFTGAEHCTWCFKPLWAASLNFEQRIWSLKIGFFFSIFWWIFLYFSIIRALAASAPIWQFSGLANCQSFYDTASNVFNDASQACMDNLRLGWYTLSAIGEGAGQSSTIAPPPQPPFLHHPICLLICTVWIAWFFATPTFPLESVSTTP